MWKVVYKPKAYKELLRLPTQVQHRVMRAVDSLHETPFEGKKLHGDWEGHWSLRVWPYRIIYTIHKKEVTVYVVSVRHRQSAYDHN